MKDLNVLKKLWLYSSIIISLPLSAGSMIENYLSQQKNQIFDYQLRANELQSAVLRKNWVSPIMLSYTQTTTTQSIKKDITNRTFSISIDQPIFKSGGIYYSIKFANAKERATRARLDLSHRQLITQALQTLFELKKNRLQKRQITLKLRNDNIDIRRKKEQYKAGLIDSSFLNEAILKRNQDRSQLLDLQLAQKRLLSSFRLISNRNPNRIRLPKLRLISSKEYRKKNLELKAQYLEMLESEYNSKITLSKYLPTVSFNASYYVTDSNQITLGQRKDYSQYGFRISMPININAPDDVEASRVSYLQKGVELQDAKRKARSDYRLVLENISIINRKIALAKSDRELYRNLLKNTKEQASAGKKTHFDVETMRNSVKISELDIYIHRAEKQIELLKLYTKTY